MLNSESNYKNRMLNSVTALQVIMFKIHTQEGWLNQKSALIHTNALSNKGYQLSQGEISVDCGLSTYEQHNEFCMDIWLSKKVKQL